jgi:serine/threonine protein kinase/tetratricopeptide (TPR) repeat protein
MTAERWEQVKDLFAAAVEREGNLRAVFLDEACSGDGSLRAEVGELIASHELAGSFMEAAAFEPAMTAVSEDRLDALLGCRIGSYQIIREIGRGGMGAVYLAERVDEAYRKQVAIKVVKRGMDSETIVTGFRRERQILASLDHPNIARLLDGGTTTTGLPYFVMDYVEGLPLDVYCDTHKLSIGGRLELFRKVCSAVHYAHQHGVVHRDLKPGNILVTAAGVPQLLDFGIAKVLDPELWPATGGTTIRRPLTPAYASPEQVRGNEMTRSSDIYSLGVTLYELLTGHRPYRLQSHTPQEIERVICEQLPEKPSTVVSRLEDAPLADDGSQTTTTLQSISDARGDQPDRLRQRLAGDLDNIVLMALRKEPERRYSTVEQLSEDIRRHLERLPIIARKATRTYRTTKFVERNRTSVITAAVSVAIVLTLIGLGATMWSATLDERWTNIFTRQDSSSDRIAPAGAALPAGAEREQLAARDTESPAALREYLIGRHFWGLRTSAGLKEGLRHFETAIELDPTYAAAHGGVADSYVGFATFRVLEPKAAYPKARAAAVKALELEPGLSEAHSALAMVSLYHDWDWTIAEGAFKHAIALNPSDATAHLRYALALPWFGRFDEALGEIARAREVDPLSPQINANEGQILYFARRYDQAIGHFRRGLGLASEPSYFGNYQILGSVYLETRAYEDAIAAYKKAIELGASSQAQADLAHAYAVSGQSARAKTILADLIGLSNRRYVSPYDIARVYAGLGDNDGAFAWLEKAYHERTRPMLSIKIDPRLDPLRSDPRLDALVRRMKVFDVKG